jgi:nucleoid-associated protein YgaU
MSYSFFIGGIQLPVPPSALSIKYPNKLNRIDLTSGREIVIEKSRGLAEISFTALLPQVRYPFAVYRDSFMRGGMILLELQKLRDSGEPFGFVVVRMLPGRRVPLISSGFRAVFSQIHSREDAGEGSDIYVDIKLIEHRDFKVRRVSGGSAADTVRSVNSQPAVKTYTVVRGDSLWMISHRFLGAGNRYREIYNLNKTMIDERNRGTGKPYYTIYPGQELRLP